MRKRVEDDIGTGVCQLNWIGQDRRRVCRRGVGGVVVVVVVVVDGGEVECWMMLAGRKLKWLWLAAEFAVGRPGEA